MNEQHTKALEEIVSLLTNLQPHIPQACYPGHAAFIDNHVNPALEIANAALREPAAPTMDDSLAAGDGTLHGAIDYWQKRALAAEAQIPSEAERDAHATNHVLANNYLELTCREPVAEAPAVSLTDEQIEAIAKPFIRTIGGDYYSQGDDGIRDNGDVEDFARAIEAAYGIHKPSEPK